MTEKQEQGEAPEAAPSRSAALPPHDAPEPRHSEDEAARPPLGEWRGPAFWMACGALLSGMAGGVFVLAQRVSVERDMMAVAATLPPAAAGRQAAPSAAPDAPAQHADAVPGPGSAAVQPEPAPPEPRVGPPKRLSEGDRAAREGKGGHLRAHGTVAKTHRKLSADAIRRWREAEEKYAEVFKRCPRPGEAGAIRCRHDICNGAEGKGPACKPYLGKLVR